MLVHNTNTPLDALRALFWVAEKYCAEENGLKMFLDYLEELAYNFSYSTCEVAVLWICFLTETRGVWNKKGSRQVALLMGCLVLPSRTALCRLHPVADRWHFSCISALLCCSLAKFIHPFFSLVHPSLHLSLSQKNWYFIGMSLPIFFVFFSTASLQFH